MYMIIWEIAPSKFTTWFDFAGIISTFPSLAMAQQMAFEHPAYMNMKVIEIS